MRFRVTSVASAESAPRLRPVLVALEDRLNAAMFTGSFGKAPDLLALIVVSVEDDETLDERWMRSHENFGSDKDPVTGRCETYVSLAIHVAPSTVESGNPGAVEETVVAAIRRRLSSPSTKGPKGFDSDACFTTVSSFLHRGGPA